MQFNVINRIIGSIFFISGTSIGAGMLGLPIKTIGINFFLIILIFLFIWLLMTLSSFIILEISLWFSNNINILNISKFICGNSFSFIMSIIYILFFYSLMSAYISGGSNMLIDLFNINCNNKSCKFFACLIFIFPFFLIFFLGFKFSDYINRFFFIILIISYLFIILNLFNFVNFNINDFKFLDFSLSIFSLPIIVTSFGYNLLIPSLKNYLFNNVKNIIITILIGSFIPFLIYLIWEYFIYSFLFNISNKLFIQTLFGYGNPAEKLIILIGNNNIVLLYLISIFSLMALISSLIGVAIGLYDFFYESLYFFKGLPFFKFIILKCVFFIPVFFSIFLHNSFMLFLTYAGAIASILLIILPAYLLWYGRYIKKLKYNYILFGGKIFIFFILFFGFFIFFIDLFYKYFI